MANDERPERDRMPPVGDRACPIMGLNSEGQLTLCARENCEAFVDRGSIKACKILSTFNTVSMEIRYISKNIQGMKEALDRIAVGVLNPGVRPSISDKKNPL